MRRHSLLLLFLLCLLAAATASSASASAAPEPEPKPKPKPRAPVSPAAAADFVRRSCRGTQYPRACEQSLLPRAPDVGLSPRRLAQAALADAADCARSCSAYIGPPSSSSSASGGGGAMRDCAETVRDAADQLQEAAAELGGRNMGRATAPRFAWRLSNVQTWASAALTDADTCLDSLATYAGGPPRDDVKRRVLAVEQATSNALALVNRLQPPRRHLQ